MRSCVVASLLTVVCCLAPEQAFAKPKATTFEKLIENSATIAVVKFAGDDPDPKKGAVDLQFLEILRGDFKPGKHRISFEDLPRFANKGKEFVVFLDKGKVWRFVAHPLNGKKLDQDLLQLDGFYDYNAYFVSPALVTLDQLQKYLKNKKLVYRFRGEVFFPEAKQAAWKAGSLTIKGTYDAVTEVAKVEGLPDLKGIVRQPKVYMFDARGERPRFDLEYSRQNHRLLTLMGKTDGVDPKTGDILVRFAVLAPEVLTQKAFEEYLADPKSSGPYYKFKLVCKRATDVAFPEVLYFYEQKSTKRYYQDTVLEGYGKTPPVNVGSSYDGKVLRMEMKTETGAILALVFNIEGQEANDNAFHWTFQRLLPYSIYRTATATGSIEINGQTMATFTATLDSVGVNREK
jgi:hypothetical protein